MMAAVEELEARYIMNTYNRQEDRTLVLVKGAGSRVWDNKGKDYLDFVGGLAVNILGHCHPDVVAAICFQAGELIHASNLYYTRPQAELARVLVEHSAGDRVFFANSGAEVNEAAIKLARKFHYPRRYKIITARRSFHGRTLATVAATGQQKYQQGFAPLPDGFSYARFNDLASFEELVDGETAAIMIEPVQGEGGIHVAAPDFIRGLRELCDRTGLLLIFDEVQCGLGRTGRLWAYENWGAAPDIFTTAKGLGGGLPIGAMLARSGVAEVFKPGDHASTFGGNPVACRAALAVLELLLKDSFLEQVRNKGSLFMAGLRRQVTLFPGLVREARGLGLMAALELREPLAGAAQQRCQERGLLVNAIGDNILRFLPPLIALEEELEQALAILEQVLSGLLEQT
ncbi:MAG TPA: aspartate aminotransferase family protein [Bacillota bacterium]|jgi:acetylornithine/N-succinyldiaminopimelate aminotransferase|nr:aspartate aminotransferase family protein [Bacillota bacterium]HOA36074.1 aspartate aminotransferase family protein [Bacillota bacterium]HOJ84056.1 aspartate aminotransferase family protein [Bacillota bacterium]HOL16074.1 aspartate aminotransferase family protein [Bacillota bacterium]HPZ11461.1 aspartate aminotransferase family protein [Bacillota bacterium]